MNSTIHQSKPNQHILLLEIDNPPANSLSKATKIEFNSLLNELEQDNDIRVLIITGRGTKFCTGDDLKEASKNTQAGKKIIANLKKFSAIMGRIEALPIPVIAAINGWCIGGGLELALCCDIRIATKSAKFISAGVNVGLTASGYRLPRLIGIGRAKYMLLTGTTINAEKAEQFGLITDIYESLELLPAAIQLAKSIANKAPLAIKATKRIANIALDINKKESKPLQQKELEQLAKSKDYIEALTAFGEKRNPKFKGV